MRVLTFFGIAALFLAIASPASAQQVIPLSHPIVQEMLNDPASTQALANAGVIYPSAQGIVVDCETGNNLLGIGIQLLDNANAAVEAAEAAYNAAVEEGSADDADLQDLLDAWDEALENFQQLFDLLEGPLGLLEGVLDAAGC